MNASQIRGLSCLLYAIAVLFNHCVSMKLPTRPFKNPDKLPSQIKSLRYPHKRISRSCALSSSILSIPLTIPWPFTLVPNGTIPVHPAGPAVSCKSASFPYSSSLFPLGLLPPTPHLSASAAYTSSLFYPFLHHFVAKFSLSPYVASLKILDDS